MTIFCIWLENVQSCNCIMLIYADFIRLAKKIKRLKRKIAEFKNRTIKTVTAFWNYK